MLTVRDFKNFVQSRTGVESTAQFCDLSEGHREFWRKLNDIGWRKKTGDPEEVIDVDATAPLTEVEWDMLDAEFRALSRRQ